MSHADGPRRPAGPGPAPAPADPARRRRPCWTPAWPASPAGTRVAVEPRHDSWWTGGDPRGAGATAAPRCAGRTWARARPPRCGGPPAGGTSASTAAGPSPAPRYGRQALATWARRIHDAWPGEADVYAYFNNDPGGAAVHDAVVFARAVARLGRAVSRTPRLSAAGGVRRGYSLTAPPSMPSMKRRWSAT